MKPLVLGIGNTLLTDEGIGVHVLQALEPELANWPDVTLLDGGTLSFTLAGPIEETDALIVVDAANIKSEPGDWTLLEGEEMDAFLMSNRKASVHEVGLTDLRAIAILAWHWPEKRAMLAGRPRAGGGGGRPAPAGAAAGAPAGTAIRDLIRTWHHV